MISKNKFGKFLNSHSFYYNGWLHNAIHQVDDILYLFNSSLSIYRVEKSVLSSNNQTFDVILKSKKKNNISFFIGTKEKNYQIYDTDLRFEKSRILIDNFAQTFYIQNKK